MRTAPASPSTPTAPTAPTARYRSIVADSARWRGFELRPGDIVVSTPAKCGTTWTQLCCALLVHDGPDLPAPLEQLSPWIDMAIHDVREVHATLDAQPHRRIIKTHTPLDGVPHHADVTYVVVGRDPRDVAVSWEHHMANLDLHRLLELREAHVLDPEDDWYPPPPPVPETSPGRYRHFISADDEGGVHLAGVIQHLGVAWERRHLDNVHLLHYADLRRDLPATLLRLAAALGIPLTSERAEELAAEATLDRMRDRADEVAPSASLGLWHDARRFLRTGGRGEWRAFATLEVEALYRRRVAALAPADLAAWLHAGEPY